MKTYWKRFLSDTPKALKKLQKVMGSISVATATMSASLLVYEESKSVAITLGIISAICGGIAAGLQFATTDKELSELK